MEKRGVLTKSLAVAGTVLIWVPILFMILTSIVGSISNQRFLFDFLIPAELFPIVLVGTLLLLWASFRAHYQRKLIGWGLVAMVIFLFGGQGIAVISGLASGDIDPTGWIWGLLIATIVLYTLAIILVGIIGILLIKILFSKNAHERTL